MRRSDLAALLDRRGVVVLDFEIVAARLLKIYRIGEVGFVGRRYAFDFVLGFVLGNVFVRLGNFL